MPPKLKRLVKSCLDAKGAKPCETLRRFCKFARSANAGCPEFNYYYLSLSSRWAADVEERLARLERRSVEMRLDRLEASARTGGVEERLAGLEERLAGIDWAY